MTRNAAETSDGSTSDMVDLLSLFRILWRRKLMIATIVAIGAVGGYLYGKNLTPKYTATAAVLVDPQQNPVLDLRAMLAA